jgi:hypothetical protein
LPGWAWASACRPLFDFLLTGVRGDEVGAASGVLNAGQELGAALGIAVLATIFFALAFLATWRLPRHARQLGTH